MPQPNDNQYIKIYVSSQLTLKCFSFVNSFLCCILLFIKQEYYLGSHSGLGSVLCTDQCTLQYCFRLFNSVLKISFNVH